MSSDGVKGALLCSSSLIVIRLVNSSGVIFMRFFNRDSIVCKPVTNLCRGVPGLSAVDSLMENIDEASPDPYEKTRIRRPASSLIGFLKINEG